MGLVGGSLLLPNPQTGLRSGVRREREGGGGAVTPSLLPQSPIQFWVWVSTHSQLEKIKKEKSNM